MPAAVILSAVRTPIGIARKGALANTPPEVLAAHVVRAAIHRAGIPTNIIDDVVLAESMAGGGVIARHAAIELGILQAAGMAVNRHCAGGLSALGVAAASIASGMERVVIAGGVQSSSMMPRMQRRNPVTDEWSDMWVPDTHPDSPDAPNRDMSITVGWNAARETGLTRQELDAWALRSHLRAIEAIDAGRFDEEIAPIRVRRQSGEELEFKTDEHPRRDTTAEKLASLPVLHPEIEGFSITAGNSSGVNDGAGALVIAADDAAIALAVTPVARIVGWTAVGVDPARTGTSVPIVVRKLLERTGRTVEDIKLWEVNEAFASVPLAACREMGLREDVVNVSGSGCSIGHPIAASGARMIATLLYELKRRGGGLGVAAMCAGGGQSSAVLIEV